jgi:hypothetical protein
MLSVESQEFVPIKAGAKISLNKINPTLNFIRFFKTLRYFVASTFAARL